MNWLSSQYPQWPSVCIWVCVVGVKCDIGIDVCIKTVYLWCYLIQAFVNVDFCTYMCVLFGHMEFQYVCTW